MQRYFWADELAETDLDDILGAGWRHFGSFFFRPDCPGCRACVPIRLDARRLAASKAQRRVEKKNADVEFAVVPPRFTEESYELWAHHSRTRFGKDVTREEFASSFVTTAVPSFWTEYRVAGRLAGLGFCDRAAAGISSVYFVFHQDFAARSLGIFSVLRECRLAVEWGLDWYHLGYWVQGNATMAYKGTFHPRQALDWESGTWNDLGPL